MSKHEKTVRRERRKSESVRRKRVGRQSTSHIKHGAAALAAAAAIAAGTQAYAAPVRFNNPAHGAAGHFHWFQSVNTNDSWLDVMLPAAQQGDYYAYNEQSTLAQFASGDVTKFRGSEVHVSAGLRVLTPSENDGYSPSLFNAAELIPVPGGGTYFGRPFSANDGIFNYPVYYEPIPEGVPTYLGVLWGATYGGGGFSDSNYGWIGGVRTGDEFEAFAWGYETDIGVPVPAGAPEPGSLALLALGAGATLGRRRRRA